MNWCQMGALMETSLRRGSSHSLSPSQTHRIAVGHAQLNWSQSQRWAVYTGNLQRIPESLRLEKTSKIIESNRHPNPTMPAKPRPEVPLDRMVQGQKRGLLGNSQRRQQGPTGLVSDSWHPRRCLQDSEAKP